MYNSLVRVFFKPSQVHFTSFACNPLFRKRGFELTKISWVNAVKIKYAKVADGEADDVPIDYVICILRDSV